MAFARLSRGELWHDREGLSSKLLAAVPSSTRKGARCTRSLYLKNSLTHYQSRGTSSGQQQVNERHMRLKSMTATLAVRRRGHVAQVSLLTSLPAFTSALGSISTILPAALHSRSMAFSNSPPAPLSVPEDLNKAPKNAKGSSHDTTTTKALQ